MLTAIETATSLYLYQALPSPTTAQPAQQRILLVAPADMPCTNTTYVAAAISKAVSAANQSISSEFRYQSTPADLVVAQLIRMESWDADWDGNGAARPLDFSLKAARAFVRALAPESLIPQATLHADGHAILFINSADVYAELEFLEGSQIGFYVRRGGEEWTDEIYFDGSTLPEGLLRAGLAVWPQFTGAAKLFLEVQNPTILPNV